MRRGSSGLVWLWALMLSVSVLASEKKEGKGEGEGKAASEYIAIAPSIVANYGTSGMHYLKADVVLRVTSGPAAQSAVLHHMPYVRHVLVMLLSDQTEDSLAAAEGKEKLRQDALASVQKILQEEEGKPLVDDLLFNSFVVQR